MKLRDFVTCRASESERSFRQRLLLLMYRAISLLIFFLPFVIKTPFCTTCFINTEDFPRSYFFPPGTQALRVLNVEVIDSDFPNYIRSYHRSSRTFSVKKDPININNAVAGIVS